ncbi:MAG: TIR domain-containing protein [Deltaproteobacteria bacterium]
MDKTIRKNQICIIGLPRCDFVYSSTRSCFIAYGFNESSLEMDLLKKLLEERGILPIEAGGYLAPAQSAFCAKICSKIITSQFCVALLNNDEKNGTEIPNANVNMEYGLMLGFNKYVIPFQKASQQLPFNIAGLDTIKYDNRNFKDKAITAIDQAIKESNQDEVPKDTSDQLLDVFILSRNYVWSPVDNEGERNILRLGSPLGFNLLHDFAGINYVFIGRFAALRPEAILWRLKKMIEMLNGRRGSVRQRVEDKIATPEQAALLERLFETLQIWVLVTSGEDKKAIQSELSKQPIVYAIDVITIEEMISELRVVS